MEHHFDIDIAKEYGIVEAVLINHFSFWLAKNKANRTNIHDGRVWTYNTKSAIQELFPYLSYDQVRRALERLVDKGVLITGCYNALPTDRTLWYSFTDEFEAKLQNCPMEKALMPNGKGTDANSIPYNSTTYNTPITLSKDKDISPVPVDDDFEKAWALYGKKGNKSSARSYWLKLSKRDREAIIETIPIYLAAKPDEKYRKDFSGWINPTYRRWEDKIIFEESQRPKSNVVVV